MVDWDDITWWGWVLLVLLFVVLAAAGFALDMAWIRWVTK